MKKNKIILASIAALMAVSPLVAFGSQTHTVQAAQKTIQTIHYDGFGNYVALSYSKNGKELLGKNKTNATMKYYGTPRFIKGQKYVCFNIGKGRYIPLDSIGKVDGKNTFRLLKNSYIYNASGRREGKLSYKYPVHFSGNLKKTSQDKKYFVLKPNLNSKGYTSSTEKYYLPYKKIKNSYYYSLGKGRYINVRNVAAINGLQNCSNGEKATIVAIKDDKYEAPVYVGTDASDKKLGKWLPGVVEINGTPTERVIVDGKTYNVELGDMIVGHRIHSGTTVIVDAKSWGAHRYRIKGTHIFIDESNVKNRKVSNYLPDYEELDYLRN